MNLLKQSSPGPQPTAQTMFGGRLTPSPHYRAASTPGSPPTTRLAAHPTAASSLLLRMGGENSAFKALVPAGLQDSARRLSDYESEDEEINVNDESEVEEEGGRGSRSSSPVEVVDEPQKACQPLQLTMHDRE